jgi:hypothetical protein
MIPINSIYKSFLVLTILVDLTSCEKKIHWDVGEGQTRLIVEASFTDELIRQKIKLTKTASFYDTLVPQPVSGAEVKVEDGSNNYNFIEDIPGSGTYFSQNAVAGNVGKGYSLSISLVTPIGGFQKYTANCVMKPVMKIDSITSEESITSFLGNTDTSKVVRFWGRDLPEEGDYYMAKLFINNKLYSDSLHKIAIVSDEAINGLYISSPLNTIFSNKEIKEGNIVSVKLYSINKEYFDFVNNLLGEQSKTEDIFGFSGPPANVFGNISDGALGYFIVSASDSAKTIYRRSNRKYD